MVYEDRNEILGSAFTWKRGPRTEHQKTPKLKEAEEDPAHKTEEQASVSRVLGESRETKVQNVRKGIK